MRILRVLALLMVVVSCAASSAQTEKREGPLRVLLIGDSISIGYTPFVRAQLGDSAIVVRPTRANGSAKNCAGTNNGVQHIERWLALEGGDWDVIHFNFGLHDLKRTDAETGKNSNDPADPRQAPPGRYEAQLRQIVRALQQTEARLIFATTTPVPEGDLRPYRAPADARMYNEIALEVMRAADIEVNDLHGFITPYLGDLQKPEDVHFTREGSMALGAAVVDAIRPLRMDCRSARDGAFR